ncbi:ABC transporter ATP-binding protein [Candidatus Saccharibacteria bacterium]|nr:MAG: ABC transporter ATP-binding protein [Candidatus Saccharibacteria bacterium]
MSNTNTSNNQTIAINVDNVSKSFLLPHERTQSIKGTVTGVFKNKQRRTVEVQNALRDITFDVKQGEFFGILGRNGSGKSTLLKILAGIYTPSKGAVQTRGKLVPFIELGVGFNPDLTGRENVYLNGAMLGFSQQEIDQQYQDIVDFAELENFMDQKLKNYSSGMQVRLAFSLATRAKADILLIDEVLAVGDASFQRKCFEYFKSLKKNKTTVIFVTHDMGAVREFCDRAILIEKSEIIARGDAEEIATKYSRLFIEQDDKIDDDPEDKERWGDGRAQFTHVEVLPKTVRDETEAITIKATIKVAKAIEVPVVGFFLQDAAGNRILGTNTQIKKQKIQSVKAGDTLHVTWQIPNILADGKHTLGVNIHETDGRNVADWWNEALVFDVKKEERTAYSITPPVDVQISTDTA